jgi:hypothetical protein
MTCPKALAVDIFFVSSPILPPWHDTIRPSHQVYMYFFKRGGVEVQFLEADLKTPLPRKLTFSDSEKIWELARRGEAWGTFEARQMLEHAIETGRWDLPEAYAGAVCDTEKPVASCTPGGPPMAYHGNVLSGLLLVRWR